MEFITTEETEKQYSESLRNYVRRHVAPPVDVLQKMSDTHEDLLHQICSNSSLTPVRAGSTAKGTDIHKFHATFDFDTLLVFDNYLIDEYPMHGRKGPVYFERKRLRPIYFLRFIEDAALRAFPQNALIYIDSPAVVIQVTLPNDHRFEIELIPALHGPKATGISYLIPLGDAAPEEWVWTNTGVEVPIVKNFLHHVVPVIRYFKYVWDRAGCGRYVKLPSCALESAAKDMFYQQADNHVDDFLFRSGDWMHINLFRFVSFIYRRIMNGGMIKHMFNLIPDEGDLLRYTEPRNHSRQCVLNFLAGQIEKLRISISTGRIPNWYWKEGAWRQNGRIFTFSPALLYVKVWRENTDTQGALRVKFHNGQG